MPFTAVYPPPVTKTLVYAPSYPITTRDQHSPPEKNKNLAIKSIYESVDRKNRIFAHVQHEIISVVDLQLSEGGCR